MNQHSPHGAKQKRKKHKKRIILIFVGLFLLLLTGGATVYGWPQPKQQSEATEAAAPASLPASPPPKVETPPPPSPAPEPAASPRDTSIPSIENGLVPVISKIPTKQPVVFLTIDDGIHKDTSDLALMKQYNLKAGLYLTYQFIKNNPAFFEDFIVQGSLVENHTMTHAYLSKLSYERQKQEICEQADMMKKLYGRRPIFLRPPGGYYNTDTRRAAADCGMKAIVMWSAKANGGSMQYQVGKKLRPGDIVLMHFRPEFRHDLESFVDAMKAAGLQNELLEDWIVE